MDVHKTAEELAFTVMNQDYGTISDLSLLTKVIENRIWELIDDESNPKLGKAQLTIVYRKEPDGDR